MKIKPEEYSAYFEDLNFRSNAEIGPKAAFGQLLVVVPHLVDLNHIRRPAFQR